MLCAPPTQQRYSVASGGLFATEPVTPTLLAPGHLPNIFKRVNDERVCTIYIQYMFRALL